MAACGRSESEKVQRRKIRLCKHCNKVPANYRVPGTKTIRVRADRAHDLCWSCFSALVAWANRRRK